MNQEISVIRFDYFYKNGCGLSEEKAKRIPESQWPGKNLHGKVITKYKNDIFRLIFANFLMVSIFFVVLAKTFKIHCSHSSLLVAAGRRF